MTGRPSLLRTAGSPVVHCPDPLVMTSPPMNGELSCHLTLFQEALLVCRAGPLLNDRSTVDTVDATDTGETTLLLAAPFGLAAKSLSTVLMAAAVLSALMAAAVLATSILSPEPSGAADMAYTAYECRLAR